MAALPSKIGISFPDTLTKTLSIPSPESAATRCSTVEISILFSDIVEASWVPVTLQLVSTTTQTSQTQNTTAHFLKDVPLPAKSSLELNKINMNEGDVLKVDCSVADKVSVIMNYMEIT